MIQEFKPVILFLLKFIFIYVVGNIAYGLWVSSYEPAPDPFTQSVTEQTSWLLDVAGWKTIVRENSQAPTSTLYYQTNAIISVYEGCNGLNTMIIFLAFLVSFGPIRKEMIWFIIVGFLIIHVANLLRVGLLFQVALYFPDSLYFVHKYLFTAFIYGVVFVLWIVWVKRAVKFKNGEG